MSENTPNDEIIEENEDNEPKETDKKGKSSEMEEWINSFFIAVIAALIIRIFIFAPTIVKGPSMQNTLQDGDRLITERVSYFLHVKPNHGDVVTFTEPHSRFYSENSPINRAYYFFLKKDYIKRVIGTEGDHVQIRADSIFVDEEEYKDFDIKGDRLYINGTLLTGNHTAYMENAYVVVNNKKLNEDYIKEPWSVSMNIEDSIITQSVYANDRDVNLDITVQKGYIYVLGDNRNNSSDSRKFSMLRGDVAAKDGCISLREISGRVLFRFWPMGKFGGLGK